MNNYTFLSLEFFVKIFNNIFQRSNIVILIGSKGITMSFLRWKKIEDIIFISCEDKDLTKKYRKFLRKYKKYYITFLLDNKESTLKHELMPTLTSFLKSNPVNQFISQNYNLLDIVAYNVYEINNDNGEIWNCSIASTPFSEQINDLIKFVITNSFKYRGIYFLSLEFESIIDRLLKKTGNNDLKDYLQIFITITESSDIKLVVKHRGNIITTKTVEYLSSKSLMYIIGTLEQEISEKLLFYKEYAQKLNLKTCIICLCSKEINDLIKDTKIKTDKIITIDKEEISNPKNVHYKNYQDDTLIEKFDHFKAHLAFNKHLKSITKLSLINNILFKPILLAIIFLIFVLGSLKYEDINIKSEVNNLNNKYYSLSNEYREIQKRHPDINNINDLVDLYNLKKMLDDTSITSLKNLKTIISFDKNDTHDINSINWQTISTKDINHQNKLFNIEVNLTYKTDFYTYDNDFRVIYKYINKLQNSFPTSIVDYDQNKTNQNKILDNIITKARINIYNDIRGDRDAR